MTNINEKVIVGMSDTPKWIKWRNKVYKVEKIGLHYTLIHGKTLFHVFSLTAGTLYMKVSLNTKHLIWELEEISDAI